MSKRDFFRLHEGLGKGAIACLFLHRSLNCCSTSNVHDRSQSSSESSLTTLTSYLEANSSLLAIILQIPPVGTQSSLRSTLLLRLTGDVLSFVPGYFPNEDELPELLKFLDELDRGWEAVLKLERWNPELKQAIPRGSQSPNLHAQANGGHGVGEQNGHNGDVSADMDLDGQDTANGVNNEHIPNGTSQPPPINLTDRTRLGSLISLGMEKLEEWLENMSGGSGTSKFKLSITKDAVDSDSESDYGGYGKPTSDEEHGLAAMEGIKLEEDEITEDEDLSPEDRAALAAAADSVPVHEKLQSLGLSYEFDDLFHRTLVTLANLGLMEHHDVTQ